MKKLIAILMFMVSAISYADTDNTTSVSFTPEYTNVYMFRGERLGGESFQPTIEIDRGNLSLGVWASESVAFSSSNVSPEVDPYGSYTFNVTDSLSIVPGFTYYTYVKADTSDGAFRQSFEPNVSVNYTLNGVKFSPEVFYDVVLQSITTQLSVSYAIPLKSLHTEFDFLVQGGTYIIRNDSNNSVPKTHGWGNYYLAGVTLPFKINDKSTVSVGYAYTAGFSAYTKQIGLPRESDDLSVARGVITVSANYTF